MSHARPGVDVLRVPRLDAVTFAFCALACAMTLGGVAIAEWMPWGELIGSNPAVDPGGGSSGVQQADARLGWLFIGVIVVESLLLVGAWRLWSRLSGRVQFTIKASLVVVPAAFFLHAGAVGPLSVLDGYVLGVGFLALGLTRWSYGRSTVVRRIVIAAVLVGWVPAAAIGAIEQGWGTFEFGTIGALIVAIAIWELASRYGLEWLPFNGLAIALGTAGVAYFAGLFAPVVLLPLVLAGIAWDILAVDFSDIMGDIAALSSRFAIPNHLVIPSSWTVDWEGLRAWVADMDDAEKPDGVAKIIGLGDFVIPSTFLVSIWIAGHPDVALWGLVGVVGAFVLLRDYSRRVDRGIPALPWVNSGVIVGVLIGIALAGVPVLGVLGV